MAKPHIAVDHASASEQTLQNNKQHELYPITEGHSRKLSDEDGDCIGYLRGNQLEIQYKSRNAGATRITKYLTIDLPISVCTKTRSARAQRNGTG